MAERLGKTEEEALELASLAGAICQLPVITLICGRRLEDYMTHLYKVPGTNKYVQKKYVRIGEGSIMYSIGRHRFGEMSRAAGAVYKMNGGTVLVSLDIFDEYMEQFREESVPMKNPLWKKKRKRGSECMGYSYKTYSETKDVMKKYVNATEGAIIYSLGKTRFMTLVKEAGAVYKVGKSALVNTEIFEEYLERFHEPAQMLPKHNWGDKTEVDIGEQIMDEETDNNE